MKSSRAGKAGVAALIAVWGIGTILTLAFWGVVVWAIIKLVGAVTGA